MKAIHNYNPDNLSKTFDVVTMSKIGKMKAIHNLEAITIWEASDVVTMSKIGKMKKDRT